MDKLVVLFGVEILKIVPGRVSTEVDAKYAEKIIFYSRSHDITKVQYSSVCVPETHWHIEIGS